MPNRTHRNEYKRSFQSRLCLLWGVLLVCLWVPAVANLTAYYPFEGTFHDVLGDMQKDFTGGPGGSMPAFVPAFQGQGVAFDGLDDYAVTDSFQIHDFSIVLWLKTPDSYPGGNRKFWNGKGIVNAETPGCHVNIGDWGLALQDTNKAGFGIGGDCEPTQDVLSSGPVNDGVWHFICCTRDGTTGEYSIYVDGGGPEETLAFLPGVDRKVLPMYLGSVNLQPDKFLNGVIDELQFFDHVLTQTEIDLIRDYGCVWGPAVPIYPLPLPDTGGLNLPPNMTFQWSSLYQGPGYLEYTLYLDTDESRVQEPNLPEKNSYVLWQEGIFPDYSPDPNAFWDYSAIENDTTYYWRVDTTVWEPNAGSPDPNLPLYNVRIDIPGRVWSFKGAPETAELTDPEPVFILPDLHTHQPEPNSLAQFDVVITSGYQLTGIEWLKNGSPLFIDGVKYQVENDILQQGVTSSTLTIIPDDPNDAGAYACRASFLEIPCETSTEAMLYLSWDVLRHRYSFNQSTGQTIITDSIDSADGQIIDPNEVNLYFEDNQLVFGGMLSADNDSSEDPGAHYVDLPNGLLSSLGNSMTLMVWFTWEDPNEGFWQRVCDFGMSAGGEGVSAPNSGDLDYLYLTPKADLPNPGMRAQFHFDSVMNLDASAPPPGQEVCVAAVWDGVNDQMRMYVNGQRTDLDPGLPGLLYQLDDRNNWLGRSQWPDPLFRGRINEFRVYSVPLTDLWVEACYEAGPDDPDPDMCLFPPETDLNGDCVVDLADLALFSGQWLKCGLFSCLYATY